MPGDQWARDEVLAASNEWVWIPRGCTHTRTDEYLVVAPPDYMGLPVLVRVFGSPRPAGDLVDDVVGIAAGWGEARTSWRVSNATVPTDLERVLLRRGGAVDVRLDVMALPIAHRLPDFGVPPEVVVREVTDEADLRDAYLVSGDAFGGERVTDERMEDRPGGAAHRAARGAGRPRGRLRGRAAGGDGRLDAGRTGVPAVGRRDPQRPCAGAAPTGPCSPSGCGWPGRPGRPSD